jgi:hypothetical protein
MRVEGNMAFVAGRRAGLYRRYGSTPQDGSLRAPSCSAHHDNEWAFAAINTTCGRSCMVKSV